MFSLAKSGSDDPALADLVEIDEMSGMPQNMAVIVGFILFGIFGLAGGGHLIVDNATKIAQHFNVSDAMIGLTIVAIGTSLPELATVIVAAYRGQTDVAIGNVLGSNVFNIFAVLGAAALTGPVVFPTNILIFDIWVMLAAIIALTVFVLRRAPIGRPVGIVFLIGYLLYIGAVASRELGGSLPA
jgi:cation:H+ antiporter